jgi:AmiR/NasT family two-component response regulator
MTRALRIAIADDDAVMRQYYQTILVLLGHEVVAVAKNGRELVDSSRSLRPDLLITDIKMGDMDGIDAAAQVCQQFPVPVILVSAHHEPDLVARVSGEHMLAYLVKPVKQADLEVAIAIALQRFEQFKTLRQEAAALRQALEDRKLIERAKYVLVERIGVSERDALQRLQKLASDKNRKLAEIAQMILLVEDALVPPSAE